MKVEQASPPSRKTPSFPVFEEPPTMDRQYSKFQQKAIKNFYDNRESISIQRLGELVTDLYLAEGKARATKWKTISTALERLGVPKAEIAHLVKKDDAGMLAKKVTELSAKE
jgi:hypothetical protein